MTAHAEVIGDPITQSKSPVIHNFWLGKLGIDAEYRACHVRSEELADYFASRRADPDWRGCNVTIPHKEAVAPLIDMIEPAAAAVGAINTVWPDRDGRLHGSNTDVDGVSEALRDMCLAGCHAVIIGAGGAARSAFAHLQKESCASVRVIARNHDKARDTLRHFTLPAQLHPFESPQSALADAGLVINATQLGMAGQMPMPQCILDGLAETAPDCMVFDMVYAPLETELLGRAVKLGRRTSHGLSMLVGQARTAFEHFFGARPEQAWDTELFGMLTA